MFVGTFFKIIFLIISHRAVEIGSNFYKETFTEVETKIKSNNKKKIQVILWENCPDKKTKNNFSDHVDLEKTFIIQLGSILSRETIAVRLQAALWLYHQPGPHMADNQTRSEVSRCPHS